ncbi:MAG TPA: flagella basal body P-ring formation protein FlgA [Bdellovibrionota bacterium]|jgi:flagella basal body P-ring formation protein FlgA
MSLSNGFHRLILAIVLALFPSEVWAAPSLIPTEEVEIQVESEVKVGGEQLILGDVATIYAKSMRDFKSLSGLVLSRIPDDKQEVRLPASYLHARIQALLPAGMKFALRAPREIVFKLQRLGLNNQDFASEISRQATMLGKIPNGVELEVLALSGIEQLKGYNLNIARIEPQAELERWRGELTFKVTRTDAPATPPVWVRTKLRWFQKAWIASRQIGYSETLGPELFTEGRIETTNLREDPVRISAEELPALLKSSKVKRMIMANGPLLPSTIERRPDASAGSLLRVVFVSESGVRVSADGSLVGPGLIGSDVKARLRASRKIVIGKMVSPGVVEVSL